MKAIINGRLIAPDKNGNFVEQKNAAIIFDEKIVRLLPMREFPLTGNEFDEIYNAAGNFVAPGFINIHIHGCMNCDTMDASDQALAKMSEFQASTGVTAYLPTTMTAGRKKTYAALSAVRTAMTGEKTNGAQILGAHLEGPFISREYNGAQSAENIIPVDFSFVEPYADIIKIITFAPETAPDEDTLTDFLQKCHQHGISPSIGHTAANEQTARRAVELGVKSFTHLFNAMSGVHHRNGGAALAALVLDATTELIADNIHVCPAAQQLVWRAKNGRDIVLVTDSARACGMGDGVSELGGQEIFVKDNVARLKDGTIAASVITLNKAALNFWRNTQADLPQIIETVSKNPAKLIGEYDKRGSLQAGKQADITVFDDRFDIKAVAVGGCFLNKF